MNPEFTLRKPHNVALGSVVYLSSCLAIALMGTFVKLVPSDVNIGTIIFFQYMISLILCVPGILKNGISSLKTNKFKAHLLRDLTGILTFGLYFLALTFISLVNASVLRSTTPFWLPLILFLWRGDRISKMLWASIILGFLGIGLVIKPTAHGYLNIGSLLALGSGFFMAISALTIRRLSATEPAQRTLFYYCLIATITSLPFALTHWVHLSGHTVLLLILIGILMYVTQYTLILAYRSAKASVLSPISYSVIVFAGILEWIIWNKTPDLLGYLGITLVILAGIATIIFERKNEKI